MNPSHYFAVSGDWLRYAETWRPFNRAKALLGLRRHVSFREKARALAKQAKTVKS